MNVLLAFDKFKDSMSAEEACACAARALAKTHPAWTLDLAPLTDGGESFARILAGARKAPLFETIVSGPRGRRVTASFGLVPLEDLPDDLRRPFAPVKQGALALADMASASGLALLASEERDPWSTSSLGTGQLIAQARDRGAQAVLLGIGGSATNDLGLGALCALGLRCTSKGRVLEASPFPPSSWEAIDGFDSRFFSPPPRIVLACDVDNPLLGPRGATAVYGPQKGLRSEKLEKMETEIARVAGLLASHFGKPVSEFGKPGSGAAGGIAFGFCCAADATLVSGSGLVSRWLDLERRIEKADLVLTGEGRFDETSLRGKGPGALAQTALRKGKNVHVFAGGLAPLPPKDGLFLHAVSPREMPLAEALRQGPALLEAKVAAAFAGNISS